MVVLDSSDLSIVVLIVKRKKDDDDPYDDFYDDDDDDDEDYDDPDDEKLYETDDPDDTGISKRYGKETFRKKGGFMHKLLEGMEDDLDDNLEDDLDDPEEDDASWQSCEQPLPLLKKGEQLSISQISLTTGKTKPPARFTEATLLTAMENPVKYMESRDARRARCLARPEGLEPWPQGRIL